MSIRHDLSKRKLNKTTLLVITHKTLFVLLKLVKMQSSQQIKSVLNKERVGVEAATNEQNNMAQKVAQVVKNSGILATCKHKDDNPAAKLDVALSQMKFVHDSSADFVTPKKNKFIL